MLFRSNDTATTEIYTLHYTLSLHDALPFSVSPVRGTLSTLTAWIDRPSLTAFVRGPLHRSLVANTSPLMNESLFAGWTAPGVEVPPTWRGAGERLAASRAG